MEKILTRFSVLELLPPASATKRHLETTQNKRDGFARHWRILLLTAALCSPATEAFCVPGHHCVSLPIRVPPALNPIAIASDLQKKLEEEGKKDAEKRAHDGLDIVHARLVQVALSKTLDPAADRVRDARLYAAQTVQEVHDGRLAAAIQDLNKAVVNACAAGPGSSAGSQVDRATGLYDDARNSLQDNLEAINDIRVRHFGEATSALGRSSTSAGKIVAAAGAPEVGLAMTEAGVAIQNQAPYEEALVKATRDRDPRAFAHALGDEYIQPVKDAKGLALSAASDALNGRYGTAILEAAAAASIATGQLADQDQIRAVDDSVAAAQASLVAMKEGRFAEAGSAAGDALIAAGQAVRAIDPESGDSLTDAGNSLKQSSANIHEDVAVAKAI